MNREQFNTTVKTEWIECEERKMKVLETVTFKDKRGKIWTAPQYSIVDGASIPKFFWRIIGSPFIGHYRRASVIHDVYCVTRSESHHDVHHMFLDAMLADGVPYLKALEMYGAVKVGGPKWDENGDDLKVESTIGYDWE
jgi:hypothetical protein